MVELGRIDINLEDLMLSFYLVLPREGNLGAVFKIVFYLRGNHNYRLALDPTYPEIEHVSFKNHKWVKLYGNIKEAIPLKMLEPMGKDIDLTMYVDSDDYGDKSTRR